MKTRYLIIALVCFAIAFFAGIVCGINLDGKFEVGEQYAYDVMRGAIEEGIEGGHNFGLKPIPGIRFMPKDDGNVSVKLAPRKHYQIAGAGGEGITRTWDGQ